jgi:hypothetical protein
MAGPLVEAKPPDTREEPRGSVVVIKRSGSTD